MEQYYLSSTDINILIELSSKEMEVSSIVSLSGLSRPTISDSISKLSDMGLISQKKVGRIKLIKVVNSTLGEKLRSLIIQNPNLDFVKLFEGNGLMIMTTFIGNGSTMKEIVIKTGLSRRTIIRYLNKWRSMGVVWKSGHGGRYEINRNYPDLNDFLVELSKYWLSKTISEQLDDPLIIFNNGEKVLFVYKGDLDEERFKPAAYTYLEKKGFNVLSSSKYFQYTRGSEDISTLEAIIQSIRIDPINPRPRLIMHEYQRENDIEKKRLKDLIDEYNINDILAEEVKGLG